MSAKVELNMPGLNELMKSEPIQEALTAAGEAVAAASGIECGVRTHVASWVAIANVYPASKDAAKENYQNNALVKGLGVIE